MVPQRLANCLGAPGLGIGVRLLAKANFPPSLAIGAFLLPEKKRNTKSPNKATESRPTSMEALVSAVNIR